MVSLDREVKEEGTCPTGLNDQFMCEMARAGDRACFDSVLKLLPSHFDKCGLADYPQLKEYMMCQERNQCDVQQAQVASLFDLLKDTYRVTSGQELAKVHSSVLSSNSPMLLPMTLAGFSGGLMGALAISVAWYRRSSATQNSYMSLDA